MSKKKIKKYRVSADDSMGMAMSVVKNAAVESDFVYFSEQKMEKFVGVEGERRMIYGCALRPDFPIYRNNGSEEYYLEFDKEAIDKISKNYFKMGFQSSWTEGHENEVEGLTITESWIKESMTLDKSIALGLDANLPIGTWFIGCYCENDEIWNAVKENKYAGFSIEALISVEEFESQINKSKDNNNMEMTNEQEMNLFEKFKKWLTSAKDEALEANPQVKEKVAEAIKNDKLPISAATDPMNFEEQPTVEPTPTVEPQTEPQNEPSEPSEPAVEPTVEPTQTVEPEPTVEPTQTEPKEDNSQLVELINSLKAEIDALKETNNGLAEKVKEMGKQPSAQPVNTNAKNGGGVGDNYANWREQMRGMLS